MISGRETRADGHGARAAPCCEKVGLKRARWWTAEEDQVLANYIAEHGEGSWRSLPKNAVANDDMSSSPSQL